MKTHLLSSIVCLSLALNSACDATRSARPNSGIDFQLKLAAGDASGLRPEGLFHIQGINNGVSVHLPVSPLDPGQSSQRVPLPAGSYSISHSPVTLDNVLGSLRNRVPAQLVSAQPFVVEVAPHGFRTLAVRTLEPSAAPRPRDESLAAR